MVNMLEGALHCALMLNKIQKKQHKKSIKSY